MPYESLLIEAEHLGIYTFEKPLQPSNKGFYSDNVICINSLIPTSVEKACILAEEIEHYFTCSGDITDQSVISNRKQERLARTRAHNRLIPLSKFVQAHVRGISNRHELAEYLDVTESFLEEALQRYREIYGTHTKYLGYTICFEPLGILEMFE